VSKRANNVTTDLFKSDAALAAAVASGLFTHIKGNLWMGGTPADQPGCSRVFRFIVNLYPWESYPTYADQVLTKVPMYDHSELMPEKFLLGLADYVNATRTAGPTLVHCQMGLNRSGLVAALALIRSGMTPSAAVQLLRRKRDECVLCNPAFHDYLMHQAKRVDRAPIDLELA
jgi:hypothetical protein